MEPHTLLHLFLRGSSNSKGGNESFQISQKERLSALGDSLTLHLPAPTKKDCSPTFSLATKRIYMDTYLKEKLTDEDAEHCTNS